MSNVISQKAWKRYISALSKINKRAADDVAMWLNSFAVNEAGNIIDNVLDATDTQGRNFIDYCYQAVQKYGSASAAMSAQMYDAMAELEGAIVPSAEMAELASYGDVAKTVNGVLKTSRNIEEMTGAISRLVKKSGCDTTLQNAYRDHAEYAWIPSGDTCAYCIGLAANGWVNISDRVARKGYAHAEHIHSNCDCTYAVRFSKETVYGGYDPQEYIDILDDAAISQGILEDGESIADLTHKNMNKEAINALRRQNYAMNRDEILKQKSDAAEKRKELNTSEAEEIKVN